MTLKLSLFSIYMLMMSIRRRKRGVFEVALRKGLRKKTLLRLDYKKKHLEILESERHWSRVFKIMTLALAMITIVIVIIIVAVQIPIPHLFPESPIQWEYQLTLLVLLVIALVFSLVMYLFSRRKELVFELALKKKRKHGLEAEYNHSEFLEALGGEKYRKTSFIVVISSLVAVMMGVLAMSLKLLPTFELFPGSPVISSLQVAMLNLLGVALVIAAVMLIFTIHKSKEIKANIKKHAKGLGSTKKGVEKSLKSTKKCVKKKLK